MQRNRTIDCNPIAIARALLCMTIWLCITARGPGDDSIEKSPGLSLRALYHPEDKIDFDGKLPTVRWFGESPARLLVKRDDQWNEFNLDTGNEHESQIDDQLAMRIGALGGLDDKQIQSAVSSALSKLKSNADSTIVSIGDSLALVSPEREARWLTREGSQWKNSTVDPSGRLVAYTRDGDLFLLHVASGRTHRLTNDGSETVLDGILDWTYQEEIFGRGNYKGFWFSADGDWLAMLRVDISGIEPYRLPASTGPRGVGIEKRYPKAGDPIPHASLWIWDLRQVGLSQIPAPRQMAQSTAQQQRIITGVWWSPRNLQLVYAISDRIQSWRELRVVDERYFSGQTNTQLRLLREESSTWVEPPTAPLWPDDVSIIWRSELPTGRNRLYKLALNGVRRST